LGDLLGEVRTSLRCLAQHPSAALGLLDEIEDRQVSAAARGLPAIERELRRVARALAQIPLRHGLEEAPKVFMFSGINRIFVDRPIREFFGERGILAKTGDVGEFLCFYESEPIVRRGFELGYMTPDEQFAPRALLAGALRNHSGRPRLETTRARAHVAVIELLDRHWRSVLACSELIFGPPIRYRQLMRAGHAAVSFNGWTEAPCTAGRYLASLEEGPYDGYVNIGAFNCVPASNATAVSHGAAAGSDLPYAVIESDGASITASQVRQLEAVAAQCWERKRRKALEIEGILRQPGTGAAQAQSSDDQAQNM
jgi:hypothetical protein